MPKFRRGGLDDKTDSMHLGMVVPVSDELRNLKSLAVLTISLSAAFAGVEPQTTSQPSPSSRGVPR